MKSVSNVIAPADGLKPVCCVPFPSLLLLRVVPPSVLRSPRLTVATSVGNVQTCSTRSLTSSSSTLPRATAPTSPRAWARTPAVIMVAPLVQSSGIMGDCYIGMGTSMGFPSLQRHHQKSYLFAEQLTLRPTKSVIRLGPQVI
jgi:hypothetical protein